MATYLGIRHLSPNGAFHIRKVLEEQQPFLVLIEGPCDFTPLIKNFANPEVVPPVAILAYTTEKPIQTLLIPFALYSPEYQAILWCMENKVECRFIDLPSDIVMKQPEESDVTTADDPTDEDDESLEPKAEEQQPFHVYQKLSESSLGNHEVFWESHIEHSQGRYFDVVNTFGSQLRQTDQKSDFETAKNLLRESHMKMEIKNAIDEGTPTEQIVVIAGSYHIDGLQGDTPIMTAEEKASLPRVATKYTLMPYSYFKLSSQSGYGAGNRAPNYYHMLWDGINKNDLPQVSYRYLTTMAREMRQGGHSASSAQIIDAVGLADALATMNDRTFPTLNDLQDATLTCFGEGDLGSLAKARTLTEIGTTMGRLPKGVSNTSVQQDFQNLIDDLKLDRYVTVTNQEIHLDLRENINVKTAKAAFIDLNRSFFFHKLRVLGVHFSDPIYDNQDNASWREKWNLQWTTEVEIALVECSLLGETIETATVEAMKKQLEDHPTVDDITANIRDSFLCGLPSALHSFISILQSATIDSTDFIGFTKCLTHLSTILSYGELRKVPTDGISDILKDLYLKALLMTTDAANCNNEQVSEMTHAIDAMNQVTLDFDFVDEKLWLSVLGELSESMSINPFLSGYATAILIERGFISPQQMEDKIIFHLSAGMDGAISANWLEGLCMKNRYPLILNLNIWKQLDTYIQTLDIDEFKRVLLFLRRAFTRFSSNEKDSIAENLQEIWGITGANIAINEEITTEELADFTGLDDFDFDDI